MSPIEKIGKSASSQVGIAEIEIQRNNCESLIHQLLQVYRSAVSSYMVIPIQRSSMIIVFLQAVDKKHDNFVNGICKSHLKLSHLDIAQLSPLQVRCRQLDDHQKGKEPIV